MTKVEIPNYVLDAIEYHATEFKGREIYGWLLGYENKEILKVIASIPCKMYKIQNEIRAEPSTEEAFEIYKSIPKGIGIIGIYHSHPNKVYHSVTDDLTVKQFANMYEHFLSIVTNGKETKSFQLIDEEVQEITFKKGKEEALKTISFKVPLTYYYEKNDQLTLALVSSEIREFLEENTKQITLLTNEKVVEEDAKIETLLKSEVTINIGNNEIKNNDSLQKIDFELHFDILTQAKKEIREIKTFISKGIIDAMYYFFKNTNITNGQFEFPYEAKFEISNIPWFFNIKKETNSLIQFFDTLAFRVQYMSFKNEKKKNKVYSEIIKIRNIFTKEKVDTDKINSILKELTKKI